MAKRVVVGMSGGVDSSAAVVLLQKEGYEVVGVTFRFIEEFDDADAKEVANKLGIEHHTVDYRKEFKELVMDRFINEYKSGITPNPCVACNKTCKIKFLYECMKEYDCDYISTGHYAKFKDNKLYRSVDLNKDQTYFLSEVPLYMLEHILFPLEGLEKSETRKIAEDAGLLVAQKKDSTDVCFIKNKFSDFMNDHVEYSKGDIIEVESKKKIGEHKGLSFYTIGQRKGLDIGGAPDKVFVVGKDIKKNILYVAYGEDTPYLISDECIIEDVNLISYHHPTFCTAKFRYRSKEQPVEIEYLSDNKIRVKYMAGAKSVTPGQTCALYIGEECIGGGNITEVYKNGEKLWYL